MKAIEIEVVSDVICPWCFLGKRCLDKAIGLLDDIKVEVNWRPFFLDPPFREGMSRQPIGKQVCADHSRSFKPTCCGQADGVPYPSTRSCARRIPWMPIGLFASHVSGKQHDVTERQHVLLEWRAGCWRPHSAAGIAADAGMDQEDVSGPETALMLMR
jgi:hypothetical protein